MKKADLDSHAFIIKTLRQLARGKFSLEEVFSHFVEMAAIALSNQLGDKLHYAEREERYLKLINSYETHEERILFPHMLGALAMAYTKGPHDALGKVFMELELGSKSKGQYFTPYAISQLMARLTMADVGTVIDQNGFASCADPCCGAGGMAIAMSEAVQAAGFDPQTQMHVVAVDIALRCVHMTYLQLALLDIPALVQFGDVLVDGPKQTWATPAHVRGGWTQKLMADRPAETEGQAQQRWAALPMEERIDMVETLGLELSAAMAVERPVAAE